MSTRHGQSRCLSRFEERCVLSSLTDQYHLFKSFSTWSCLKMASNLRAILSDEKCTDTFHISFNHVLAEISETIVNMKIKSN